jgi:outer membrane DcaP-like protein
MALTKRFAKHVLAVALALPLAASADDAPGTFRIPGTDSTIKLYGYVQLDATYDFKGRDPNVEGNDWATIAPTLPFDNSFETRNKPGHLYFTARTSRIGLQTATPTRAGNVGVRMEGDFNAPNLEQGQTFTNSVGFRLRHAYGQVSGGYGTFLIGQTWSTFLDLASVADTVDFNGPGSIALLRNPMIRYQTPAFSGWQLAVAAENAPGTDGNDFSGATNITKYQQIPDFVANLSTAGSWGTFSVAGATMNFARASSTLGAPSYSKQGIAASVSGSLKLAGDTIVAHVEGGSGAGRYLFNTLGNFGVDTGSSIFLTDAVAYHVGYTHVWNSEFRSNGIFSQTFIAPNAADVNQVGSNQRIDQVFANTFWTFAKNAEVGVEYIFGRRHTFGDDQQGTQHRLSTSFHYNFF